MFRSWLSQCRLVYIWAAGLCIYYEFVGLSGSGWTPRGSQGCCQDCTWRNGCRLKLIISFSSEFGFIFGESHIQLMSCKLLTCAWSETDFFFKGQSMKLFYSYILRQKCRELLFLHHFPFVSNACLGEPNLL